MRRLTLAALALGGSWWHGAASAQQQEDPEAAPDLDFLEYLGAWAEEDDEWLAIEEWHKGNAGREAEGEDRERYRRIPPPERNDDDESE
jgi:hypothetical protein